MSIHSAREWNTNFNKTTLKNQLNAQKLIFEREKTKSKVIT